MSWHGTRSPNWIALLNERGFIIPGRSRCHWLWAVEKLCHDWTGSWRGRGHCDRHGHHREVQPQQTVPLQTIWRYGQYHLCSSVLFGTYEVDGVDKSGIYRLNLIYQLNKIFPSSASYGFPVHCTCFWVHLSNCCWCIMSWHNNWWRKQNAWGHNGSLLLY